MNKKTIAIFAVCMVLVAALSVFTTLALLTDSKSVTNTFTSGNVSIKLDETAIKHDGVTADTTIDRTLGNVYKLYPNQSYTKDPMVTVNIGSEPCYVGAVITVTAVEGNNLENLTHASFGWDPSVDLAADKYLSTMGIVINAPVADDAETADVDEKKAGWVVNKTATEYVYTYVYSDVVDASASAKELTDLFESFTVPGKVSNTAIVDKNGYYNSQLKVLEGLEIKVTAYAAQAQTFNSAEEALSAAFPAVFSPTNAQ